MRKKEEDVCSTNNEKIKIGICACSNGIREEHKEQIKKLAVILEELNCIPVFSPNIFCIENEYSGTDKERADDLMAFYKDESIRAIFDISGGDLANGILKYLDFDVIKDSDKIFYGYSDLTTVINAIYTKTNKESVLYQLKNVVWDTSGIQKRMFTDYIRFNESVIFQFNYKFLQGDSIEGVVVGGNIRCLLKLAGTEYWPDMYGKILFLESLGGECALISSYFNQLEHLKVFERVKGIILGTFTSFEKANLKISVFDLLKFHISRDLPVLKTDSVGHATTSKAIVIGRKYKIGTKYHYID